MNRNQSWGSAPRACRMAAVGLCLAGSASNAGAATPPSVEARIMTQLGLGQAMALELLQNELGVIDNYSSGSKCRKVVDGGSVKTLSSTKVSATEYKAKINAYFDTACAKPYAETTDTITISNATETFSITETASYLQPNGKVMGTLDISDVFSVTSNVETLRGLGKFTPTGGQPAADVGFTCSIPTTDNAKTANCQGGVAQTFRSLNKSLAFVAPFTLTAANNTATTSVKLAGTSSNLRTGPAGSLSITAPDPKSLGIGGGGTAYSTTTLSGGESHFSAFPPAPTLWTFTDTRHNAAFNFHIVSNTTHAARAAVHTISPAKGLAAIALDESGTGKVTYADGRSAPVRGFLAGN